MKAVSAKECPLVSGQRVEEVGEIVILRHYFQGQVWKGHGKVGLNVHGDVIA